tara:strand:+ start:7784 stop:8188 length:405 start_codon:yes stop_codon:yes gene_type:complete
MNDETKNLIKKLRLQVTLCCTMMVLIGIATLLLYFDVFANEPKQPLAIELSPIAAEYDVSLLDDFNENLAIKYGHQLFTTTPKYMGPDNGNPNMVYAGNRLACNNCHLQSGTKPYSAPLIGIVNRFPSGVEKIK